MIVLIVFDPHQRKDNHEIPQGDKDRHRAVEYAVGQCVVYQKHRFRQRVTNWNGGAAVPAFSSQQENPNMGICW